MELALGLQVLMQAANRPPRAGRNVRDIIEYLLDGNGGIETDAFQMTQSRPQGAILYGATKMLLVSEPFAPLSML
jgi:hypothetical protein